MIDISAEREAAEKLRQAEGVNDAIIRTAMDAIVSADEYGVVIEFNAAAEAMFGYSRKEAVGRSLSELIIPEAYRKQHEAGIAKALETGKSNMSNRRMQVEAMRADGSTFPVELTIGRADLGSHSIFVGEVRDMTKQRRDKAERKHLSSVLDNALKILPSGLAVTGAKGKILLCNDAFAQPFGATAADIIGRRDRGLDGNRHAGPAGVEMGSWRLGIAQLYTDSGWWFRYRPDRCLGPENR
jgi:PAS domain S-box-containing protein